MSNPPTPTRIFDEGVSPQYLLYYLSQYLLYYLSKYR